MPSGTVHQFMGAGAGLGLCLQNNYDYPEGQINPLWGSLVGALFGKLPDQLEPAINPNHRQFFHSVAVLIACGYGVNKIYQWKPETPSEIWLRRILLIGGVAYASHLVLDGTTSKSLPLLGKL